MGFAIFPVHMSKVLRLPRTSAAKSYEVLHLSRKMISANLKIRCSKMQPLSGNQRPELLRNVLRATTACTFSTSQLPNLLRSWCALYSLTWKCASRHNGVHFFDISTSKSGPTLLCFVHLTSKCAARHYGVQRFISHLARWLRTRRFSDPTFRPSGTTNDWKNTVFRDFPTVLSSEFLFFDFLSSSLLFSDSSHLCFSSVHIVGNLTSKLPSIIWLAI